MKILLIDNYDSFTYNLFRYISNFKKDVEVVRNDKIDSKTILRKKYNKNTPLSITIKLTLYCYFSKKKCFEITKFDC